MNRVIGGAAVACLALSINGSARAQIVNEVYTGSSVFDIQTSKCGNGQSDYILYNPTEISFGVQRNTTIKLTVTNATAPFNGGPVLTGGGYYVFYLKSNGSAYFYTFTNGSQTPPTQLQATVTFKSGTDPLSGLPTLGFLFTTTATCSNGSKVPFTIQGNAIGLPLIQ